MKAEFKIKINLFVYKIKRYLFKDKVKMLIIMRM